LTVPAVLDKEWIAEDAAGKHTMIEFGCAAPRLPMFSGLDDAGIPRLLDQEPMPRVWVCVHDTFIEVLSV
jgi:hypothetical protein